MGNAKAAEDTLEPSNNIRFKIGDYMLTKYIRETIDYNGTQLSSLWAYKNFGLQGDSIIAFRGKCDVKIDKMVDMADVLANDHIYSEDMLSFIVEFFDSDLEKTIYKQRMLITIIKEILEKACQITVLREGDDLYYKNGKLSVSIATLSPVSSMIHTGINISSINTPVKAAGLFDLGLTEIEQLAAEIMEAYKAEIASIKMARCKVRGVF